MDAPVSEITIKVEEEVKEEKKYELPQGKTLNSDFLDTLEFFYAR